MKWRISFKLMDKKVRFTSEVLLYSGLTIEKCGCLAHISFAERQLEDKSGSIPLNDEPGSKVIDASDAP
jgi:hypothetical protein